MRVQVRMIASILVALAVFPFSAGCTKGEVSGGLPDGSINGDTGAGGDRVKPKPDSGPPEGDETQVCDKPGAVPVVERPAGCYFEPPVGQFNPVIQWQWSKTAVLPSFNQVTNMPVVINLTDDNNDGKIDNDDIPEIVFPAYSVENTSEFMAGAVLVALSGDSGREIFVVNRAGERLSPQSGLAAGDIDGDKIPEIVGATNPTEYSFEGVGHGSKPIAFEHDGRLKWVSQEEAVVGWGAPAIADLDGDGGPEIVFGNKVFRADGSLRWKGDGGNGGLTEGDLDHSHQGSLPLVANVDALGRPEVVAGNTLYDSDGRTVWKRSDLADGLAAVANFDCDGKAEIALTAANTFHILDADGRSLCGPEKLPGEERNNRGGAPTVADFDGDGQVEAGVAGAEFYNVFELDCSLLWKQPTRDWSSNVSSSSVFDFEGDGKAEVVYNDERNLRIYSGIDGSVLFEHPNPSDTTFEYPVIADVDNDGNAEIVVVANNWCRGLDGGALRQCLDDPDNHGVKVFKDASDNWVTTRRIWNEHSYHVTNVNEDGTIPPNEENNWELYNNFRQNVPVDAARPWAAPDLTLREPMEMTRVVTSRCPSEISFGVRVENRGDVVVGAGISVAYYKGDPQAGGALIGTKSTPQLLNPEEGIEMLFTWQNAQASQAFDLYMRVDDDGSGRGQENECREDNNTLVYQGVKCE